MPRKAGTALLTQGKTKKETQKTNLNKENIDANKAERPNVSAAAKEKKQPGAAKVLTDRNVVKVLKSTENQPKKAVDVVFDVPKTKPKKVLGSKLARESVHGSCIAHRLRSRCNRTSHVELASGGTGVPLAEVKKARARKGAVAEKEDKGTKPARAGGVGQRRSRSRASHVEVTGGGVDTQQAGLKRARTRPPEKNIRGKKPKNPDEEVGPKVKAGNGTRGKKRPEVAITRRRPANKTSTKDATITVHNNVAKKETGAMNAQAELLYNTASMDTPRLGKERMIAELAGPSCSSAVSDWGPSCSTAVPDWNMEEVGDDDSDWFEQLL